MCGRWESTFNSCVYRILCSFASKKVLGCFYCWKILINLGVLLWFLENEAKLAILDFFPIVLEREINMLYQNC